jgi:sugar lactone lactonase YvrE
MSSSNSPRVALPDPPEELKDMAFDCVLMDDPVVAADGHTYNRVDIENWLKHHNTSPHTNEEFESKALIPNIAMRRQINAWREEHGLPALTFARPAKAQAQAAGGGGAAADGAQLVKPSAVCAYSKKALEAFCVTCKRSICSGCAIDSARCKSHETRPLATIVSLLRAEHDAWVQVEEGQPQQLQSECARVDAAADAVIAAFTSRVREEAAELKLELQRACVGDVAGVIREQAQLLADVELAAASPEGCVAGSEAARCLLAAVTRAPRLPPPDAGKGRFEAAAAAEHIAGGGRLGRVVAGVADAAGALGRVRVGAVAAAGAGFARAIGSHGSGNGQLTCPYGVAFDGEGNLVVADGNNNRIQVFRYSDGAHLRSFGSQGAGAGQFIQALGIAFDGAGHIIVSDHSGHRVQVLRYSDGAHVRTFGNHGSGNGQFANPNGIAVDGEGNVAVFDHGNARVQVFRLSDGAYVRTIGSKGSGNGQFAGGHCGVAFDSEGNLVVADYGNHRVQVVRYSDGAHVRTIGSQGAGAGQFQYPTGVAFDAAGHIVVVDRGNHRVQVLRYSDGAHVRSIGSHGSGNGQLNCPCGGIAIDSDGRVVVADTSNSRVQVFQ